MGAGSCTADSEDQYPHISEDIAADSEALAIDSEDQYPHISEDIAAADSEA